MHVAGFSTIRISRLYLLGGRPGTHLCQSLSRPWDHSVAERIKSMKNTNGHMGNHTRDFMASSKVPQPSPRTPQKCNAYEKLPVPSRSYAKTVFAIYNRFHFLYSEYT
jgi:hypothetical protein